MAKTDLILTHNVVGLGSESDHVKVAAGYARNYLIPQGLAIPLNAANKKRIEALQKRRSERESRELTTMTELAQALSKLTLVITVKTGEDGKLFGSVTAGTIADELKHQFDATLDKRKIHLLHPIKTLGDHEVELKLHQDVNTVLKLKVQSSNTAANQALADAQAQAAAQKAAAEAAQKQAAARKSGKTADKGEKEEKPAKAAKKPEEQADRKARAKGDKAEQEKK